MKEIKSVEIYWHTDLPIARTGIYQILYYTLQLHLRAGTDANIALAYLQSKLAKNGWHLSHNTPCIAVPAVIATSFCDDVNTNNNICSLIGG